MKGVRTAVPVAPEDTRPGPVRRLILLHGCRDAGHRPGGHVDDVLRRLWLLCADCGTACRYDLLTGKPG